MDVGILGSLEVRDDAGGEVRVPAGRERALLALLVLERGRVVPVDRIIAALWGERPPGTAGKAVQGYVSHLRRLLPEGVLLTRAPGYVLQLPEGALDAARFEALAADARNRLDDGDHAGALSALDDALALWRGAALADFAYDDFARDEARRLEEARLGACEDRADALLRAGRSAGLAGELEGLVAAHPLRERLRALAMVALYREGRQAEALELYDRGRRSLSAELGVDPGPELTAAHRAILTQDPSLGAPARPAATASPVPRGAPSRRTLRRLPALGGALALLVVALVVGVALTRDDGGVAPVVPAVVAIDPGTDAVVAHVPAGSRPTSLAGDETGVWVGDARDGTVSRIDATTMRVVRTSGIGVPAVDLALGAGALWAAAGGFGEVVRIDPGTGAVLGRVPLGAPGAIEAPTVSAVAAADDTVWAGARGGIVPIDAATGTPGRVIDLDDSSALQIAVSGDSVWATTLRRRAVRVERTSRQVTGEFYAGEFVLPLVLDGQADLWVGAADAGRVWRVDALTSATLGAADAGAGSNAMAAGAGAVWVGSWPDRTVVRLDAQTGEVRSVIPVGGEAADLAFGAGLLWVAVPEVPEAP